MKKMLFLGALAVVGLALLRPAARAVDQDMLNKAVDAGVAHLKRSLGGAAPNDRGPAPAGAGLPGNPGVARGAEGPPGGFPGPGVPAGRPQDHYVGVTSLVAMTLLECGVPGNDNAIKNAAETVRQGALTETQTYDIALAILFLDKLRDQVDVSLIESLTVRLLAGQGGSGGWGYECPTISGDEAKRLADLLKGRNELKGNRDLPKGDDAKRSPNDLTKEIKDQLGIINRGGNIGGMRPVDQPGRLVPGRVFAAADGDNSNTQFATLALWVARRQGLPVEGALGRVSLRFRKTVNHDGSWSYVNAGPGGLGNDGEASMTCAGLLALAVSYGVATELAEEKVKPKDGDKDKDGKPKEVSVADIAKDPLVLNGLRALSTAVGHPASKLKALGQPANIPKIDGQSYYYLWSLERVCMALDIDAVGGKDWYEWGAEILFANQQHDGSWAGSYSNYNADTCFALLFLKRSNFARDLSAKLHGKLDQRSLRGGVGGEGLKEKIGGGLTSAKEGGDKSSGPKETKPPAETREVDRVAREVVDAKGNPAGKLLEDLHSDRDRKYTEALLVAISQLDGDGKKGARKVLAERLAKEGKVKPEKLGEYLGDRDSEVRRAAALACALNESKQHVPQLIGLLRDREALVSRAAWASLKNLTGQNLGPTADATDAEKDKAIEAWREWWTKNGK
jgi:hypothetical protein